MDEFQAMNIADIASICHEANRAYCVTIGDLSQPAWDEAPQWQKDSAVQGVRFVLMNPNVTAQQQHDNWMTVKLKDGWRYGPVKDPAVKEHPCLVEYEHLPDEQKIKDTIFSSIVRTLRDRIVWPE